MLPTLAFDIYGTLINPLAMSSPLAELAGQQAGSIAILWRETQLNYSFRRAAMRAYVPFSQVTAEALSFALEAHDITAPGEAVTKLLNRYRRLPAFEEVPETLKTLAGLGLQMHAFSNGTLRDIRALTDASGLSEHLGVPVSVEETCSFKPDPRVYALFCEKTDSDPNHTWLISGNAFDIVGAGNAGWKTIWVRRASSRPFDSWGEPPTYTVSDLSEIAKLFN